MIISCDDTRYGMSSGDDWTKINYTRKPGFNTYKGILLGTDIHKFGKLTGFSLIGQYLPNFDMQVSMNGSTWTSLIEGHFDNSDMDHYKCLIDNMLTEYNGYRFLVTSRDPWIIDTCEFIFERPE